MGSILNKFLYGMRQKKGVFSTEHFIQEMGINMVLIN